MALIRSANLQKPTIQTTTYKPVEFVHANFSSETYPVEASTTIGNVSLICTPLILLFIIANRIKKSVGNKKSTARKLVHATAKEYSTTLNYDEKNLIDVEAIQKIIPHRYPFLLVDKIIEIEPTKRAVGVKCITANEELFNGHFPDKKVFPGVLQVEALAQLAGACCLHAEDSTKGIFLFAGASGIKWKRPVQPGDVMTMEVEITKWAPKFGLAKAKGTAYVRGHPVITVDEMQFAMAK